VGTFKQFLLEGYIAFVLDPESRQKILTQFPPKFSEVYADHITYEFGVPRPENMPEANDVKVVGYAETNGIEALVVSVNGDTLRNDGSTYHITMSLDRRKGFSPKDAKTLLKGGWQDVTPFSIHTRAEFIK
jgi:hypothetical protein